MLIARLDPVARNLLIGHPHPAAADAEYEKVIAVEASEAEKAHDEIAVSLRPRGSAAHRGNVAPVGDGAPPGACERGAQGPPDSVGARCSDSARER